MVKQFQNYMRCKECGHVAPGTQFPDRFPNDPDVKGDIIICPECESDDTIVATKLDVEEFQDRRI